MINAQTAYDNMISHQARTPIRKFSTIEEMIRVSSLLGAEKIEVFLLVKDEHKIKNKLKQLGFILNSTYIKSLPDEVLVEINWVTAEFIGHTEKEISK